MFLLCFNNNSPPQAATSPKSQKKRVATKRNSFFFFFRGFVAFLFNSTGNRNNVALHCVPLTVQGRTSPACLPKQNTICRCFSSSYLRFLCETPFFCLYNPCYAPQNDATSLVTVMRHFYDTSMIADIFSLLVGKCVLAMFQNVTPTQADCRP